MWQAWALEAILRGKRATYRGQWDLGAIRGNFGCRGVWRDKRGSFGTGSSVLCVADTALIPRRYPGDPLHAILGTLWTPWRFA